ncbi:SanA/YdcF family protein [Wielerella bovis]|uniref:SanA/YdcF family protein n=1 Tax=Wielerella bovis TaxID=2917790 RepID=UPI0020195945|nr:ElyC/SanA/YdcF family protein [Wielerella bovis]MCG7656920.1 YdcF family protein [Wielerella bovis]MCG7659143.1 YdcF family protein [Wielerella bovis]
MVTALINIVKKGSLKMWYALFILLSGCLIVYAIRCYTAYVTAPYLFDNPAQLPMQKTALLLGTNPKLKDGRNNLYFDYRIRAAADLYHANKIRYIIVSGDNRKNSYNEPDYMKAALIAQGIPAERIYPDYAGIRTLDSVLRAHAIFGQQRLIIISQKFHNERAVYLAQAHGIEAYGYNATDVDVYNGFKTQLREYGARVKMLLDVWTGKTARHGGDKIVIPE